MNTEIYVIYQGMRARQRALDVIANNIANASTSGFKADRLLYRSFEAAQLEAQQQNPTGGPGQPPAAGNAQQTGRADNQTAAAASSSAANAPLPQPLGEQNLVTGGTTDFSSGSLRQTGRSLDVAITGDGFFAVQTPRGERYTRAGAFTLDSAGQLVTPGGDLVIGQNGPITVPPGEVSFGEDGTLSVNGKSIDRLKVVRFTDPRASLLKEGASLFAAAPGVRAREDNQSKVEQGSLELSNVNSVAEMAAMMQNGREFESLQRSISLMMNELGRKVASELGRL